MDSLRRSERLKTTPSTETLDRCEVKKKKETKKSTPSARRSKSCAVDKPSSKKTKDSTKKSKNIKPKADIIETEKISPIKKSTVKRRQNTSKSKRKSSSKVQGEVESESPVCKIPLVVSDESEMVQEPLNIPESTIIDVDEVLDFLVNSPEKSINDLDTNAYEESIFDKTMYYTDQVGPEEEANLDDRDWNADINPDLDIQTKLEMKPIKSCLSRKPKKKLRNRVNTYKYFDNVNNRIVYIIGGYSNSTYIRRIIIYLQAIEASFEMILLRFIVPEVNLEAKIYGSLQSFLELFQDEVISMLTYSIFNKDVTPYFEQLMRQFNSTIPYFLFSSINESHLYHFNVAKKVLAVREDEEDRVVNDIEKTILGIFCENLYLFNSVLLYQVFNRKTHYSVLREMFSIFKASMLAAAQSSMSVA